MTDEHEQGRRGRTTPEGEGRDGAVLRPLGAFEQVFHLYALRHPVCFSLTAHLTTPVEVAEVQRAAAVLQQVHPLLAATVVDEEVQGRYRASYRRSTEAVPVTTAAPGTPWPDVLAAEQVRPFALGRGPHWRVVLLAPSPAGGDDRGAGGPPASTLVLTFDHRIADGSAGLRVLEDLLAVLDGHRPPARALAPAEEDLVLAAAGDGPGAPPVPHGAEGAGGPPVPQGVPATLRAVDGAAPDVSAIALSGEQTTRLREACRARGVTVHSALAAALTRALAAAGREPARVVHPTDLRRLLDLGDDVALRIRPAPPVTAVAGASGQDLWSLARGVGEQVRAAREPGAVVAAVRALQAGLPTAPDEAVAGMLAMSSTDAMLTDLGVVDVGADGRRTSLAGLEALAMSVGISGEQVVGALTHRGRLRLTSTSHAPVPGLLDRVADELDAACTEAA